MALKLDTYLERRIEHLSEGGYDEFELERSKDNLRRSIAHTSQKIALVAETEAGVGGFIRVGDRTKYHLSADLVDSAILSGETREIMKVADHETVHLISAQNIDLQTANFTAEDAQFLAAEYDLNLKRGEDVLSAFNRYIIEGLTEAKSQQRKWADPNCAYTNDEVPATVKMVFDIQQKLGINLFRQFNQNQELAMGETLKALVTHLRLNQAFAGLKMAA